ncbi:hypothetical protein ACRRTK_020871 [Alexandromys fortis]
MSRSSPAHYHLPVCQTDFGMDLCVGRPVSSVVSLKDSPPFVVCLLACCTWFVVKSAMLPGNCPPSKPFPPCLLTSGFLDVSEIMNVRCHLC